MPTIQILSSKPLAGKTTIAVALAQGFAATGAPVQLLRAGAGEAAIEDAATFVSFLFAGSPGAPIRPNEVPSFMPPTIGIVELDAGAEPLAGVQAFVAVRGSVTEADVELGRRLGDRLAGAIALDVLPGKIEDVARAMTNGGLRPLALIPEERALAAPSVGEIKASLSALVLYEGENDLEVVADVLIAPVYADPAQPHFRRFASKAVLAPFNKTDLHLAAIETQAACLVITGGHQPSPYVVDRAQHGTTTVLLADKETPETLASLSEVWLTSRFRGERKAAAAFAHLEGRIDFAAIVRRIAG